VRWLQQLRSDPRFSLVSVAGHSEGSLTGIVAAERTLVDRVISIDGTGRRAGDLILSHGTTDTEVPISDATLLADANRSASLRIIPGMNQVLKDVPLDDDEAQNRSYYDPTLPIDALVAAIGDFIKPPIRRRVVR
jgi:hypothetical protein